MSETGTVPITDDLRKLRDIAQPLLEFAGLPIAPINFVTNLLHTFVTLHGDITKVINKQKAEVDSEIKAREVFLLPFHTDTSESDTIRFFQSPLNRVLYPKAFDQLRNEITILLSHDTGYLRWNDTINTLMIAKEIIPDLEFDQKFDHDTVLGRIFDQEAAEVPFNYRQVIARIRALNPAFIDVTSHKNLNKQISPYIRAALDLEQRVLHTKAQKALEDLSKSIEEIIRRAILGEDGATKQIADFIIAEEVKNIESEIKQLTQRQSELKAKEEKTPLEVKEIERIEKRIEELKAKKSKLTKKAKG